MSNAMDQERELDQLLSQWLTGRQVSAPESLQPLLTAANMLTPLRQRRRQPHLRLKQKRVCCAAHMNLCAGGKQP